MPTNKDGSRLTKAGALAVMKRLGFKPNTIFDIGFGLGTEGLYGHFEDARYVLVDPIEETRPLMQKFCDEHPGSIYFVAGASDREGAMTVVYSPGVTGSGVFRKPSERDPARQVPALTLDGIQSRNALPPPYLVKLDVEGYELSVLGGASAVLKDTEAVICELSLWDEDRSNGRASLRDVFDVMEQHSFVLYDVIEPGYRAVDNAMQQFDGIFVKKNSALRAKKSAKTAEQAAASFEHKRQRAERTLQSLKG